ncbi:MAG: Glutamyl-tRNA reductase [Cyanobacteriota bacterium erpe_2018_sw_21hr_WHONDRS-SW48-000092_B_bin.40]|jgi:glutamyl-tRNA reductase|nr:Glutamyl-tRNA reductase [Cyanobacteriota bacterium erpe_2018_sw_21hr_WHONDRS-SW48-000092_B_bin.40]
MNHLVVSGINYHSAPIAIREQFCIPDSCIGHALEALKRFPHIKEAAILSTCNRTEVYAVVDDVAAGLKEIDLFFSSVQSVSDHEALKPNFRLLRDDVVLHILRVAAGLDSMILGEGQIMSQVKASHQAALEHGTAGPILDIVFKLALTNGKRVRSETTLGKKAVSVSSAAVELAKDLLGSLKDKSVAIIGMGKMGQICTKHLLSDSGQGPIVLFNRNSERIENFLSNKLNNKERLKTSFSFEERTAVAAQADLVIVATGSKQFVLQRDELARQRHKNSPKQIIIDISVPRNVDPAVAELDGVELYIADDLSQIVAKNMAYREALISDAETIIYETLEEYHNWERSQLVVPTIAILREKIEAIRQEHMAKNTVLPGLNASGQDMEAISRAIINQILHHPTVQLKATKDYEILRQQAEALRTLFNLDPLSPLATNSMAKFASQQSSACAEARKSRAMQEKIQETAPSSQRPILN